MSEREDGHADGARAHRIESEFERQARARRLARRETPERDRIPRHRRRRDEHYQRRQGFDALTHSWAELLDEERDADILVARQRAGRAEEAQRHHQPAGDVVGPFDRRRQHVAVEHRKQHHAEVRREQQRRYRVHQRQQHRQRAPSALGRNAASLFAGLSVRRSPDEVQAQAFVLRMISMIGLASGRARMKASVCGSTRSRNGSRSTAMMATPFLFQSLQRLLFSLEPAGPGIRRGLAGGGEERFAQRAGIRASVTPLQNTPSAEKLCWVSE